MIQVGDIVTIRKDLKEGHSYRIYCNDEMELLKGRLARIIRKSSSFYASCVDNGRWDWTEDMFEGGGNNVDRR